MERRNEPEFVNLVDELYDVDKSWRSILKEVNSLRSEKNTLSEKISSSDNKKPLIEKVRVLKEDLDEKEERLSKLETKREEILMKLPNLVDEDVPYGEDESDNEPVDFNGIPKVRKEDESKLKEQIDESVDYEVSEDIIHHADLVNVFDIADTDKGGKVGGSRFYYQKNELTLLDLALSNYALEKLHNKGFQLMTPPFLVKKWVEECGTSMDAFEDTLYKVEDHDLYLIPTSEHPLAAYFQDTILKTEELPKRLAGYSPCFRREAGSHGKDTKGIFRTHQFNKVEQYIICEPEEAEREMEKLVENSGNMLEELNIPYRNSLMCTGDMDKKVVKQYDMEGWFPGQAKFRELMSFGNVMSWQARRMKIRYWDHPGADTNPVATIYGTGLAIQRTLLAMFENNYRPDGTIKIPEVLHKYLPFKELKPKKEVKN